MRQQMLIGGKWIDALDGGISKVVNPATEEVVAEVPFGGAAEAEMAVDAAASARPLWAGMTAYERGAILRRASDMIRDQIAELARILTLESGKPLTESRGEWQSSADLFEWFAEEGKRAYGRTIPARKPGKRLLSIPVPVGVVATITAWNFPAYLAARKWSAALAAGCPVVGRPSELTPLSAIALAQIIHEAGAPAGVINLVNGSAKDAGQVFLDSPNVDKVSFTGSQSVGRILMEGAARRFKRLSLELGGSAPVLVFPDVDVEWAARQAVTAKFRNSGQVCISPSRYYVHADIMEEFAAAAGSLTDGLVVGNGLEENVTTGPLVTAGARDSMEGFVDEALSQGARLVSGGKRPAHLPNGYFFEPTVLADVKPMMRISCEEVFGPIMPVASFETLEEALRLANDSPFGLSGYVMTQNLSWATQVYEGLQCGIVGVNDLVPATAEGPFGGLKESGFGREGSQEGLHEYMETKFVSMAL